LVLTAVPEGRTAEVASDRLTHLQMDMLETLKLQPGEVRELTKLGRLS
jgi:hypothetical protein